MKFGHFDPTAQEFVIQNPRTPAPWINYLGTLSFGGYIDQTGGLLLCRGDPSQNRITYYPPCADKRAFKGESAYAIVDRLGASTSYIYPYCAPAMATLESYECRVGPGYSIFTTRTSGLQFRITVLVPPKSSILLRSYEVTNEERRPLRVTIVPVVRYSHFDAIKQLTNADWVPQTMQSDLRKDESGRTILLQYPFMRKAGPVNFFSTSLPVSSFETRLEAFLGDSGYGTWDLPESIRTLPFKNGIACRGENIAALEINLQELQAGETRAFTTCLGQADSIDGVMEQTMLAFRSGYVEESLAELRLKDQKRRACFSVSSPNPEFDTMASILGPRQCAVTRQWSRYLSAYQTGYGSRGIGFRDSCQDLLAYIQQDPNDAASLLLMLLSFQRPDGSAWHQFNPLTMEASIGDAEEMADRARYYGDDHLWAVIAVSAYIMETGDADFLNREASYHQSAKSFSGSGTVLEHLLRALDFTDASTGTHGLPLLGFADWNDTINLSTGAESCLCACLYGYAASRLAEVLEETDSHIISERDSLVRNLRKRYEKMRACFLACAWNGSWFAAYFEASGKALGSSATDARIFSYAQSWPVIAGFAPPKLGIAAMDALERLLFTNRGIKLMNPPYTAYDPDVGGVSTYPPGAKENGGIFMHTNPWAVLAECELGRTDRAYTYFSRMNPLSRLDEVELYGAEPYVYAQNVLGDEHKDFGLARNSWLTGTASWAQIAAQEGILGIRPRANGLHLIPNLPSSWDGYKAIRRYRGCTVSISVKRARVTQPVLVLDGRLTDSAHGETASGKHVSFLVPFGYLSGKKFVNAELQVPETH